MARKMIGRKLKFSDLDNEPMMSVRNVELEKRNNEQCCPRYRGDVQRYLPYQPNHESEPTQNSLKRVHQYSRSCAFGGIGLTLHQLD
jgi:hypothetical protein